MYLECNTFPSSKASIRQVETQAEKIFTAWLIIVCKQTYHDEQNPLLYIPESCVDHTLDLYHNSLPEAHQDSIRTF